MKSNGALRAYVLGGGVAGLAAAFGLADRGFAVELLESRRQLGGRAFSTGDRVTGQPLDNGYHAMLGCYRAMRALLRRLGTERLLQCDRSLSMAYRFRGGRSTVLRLSRLPVPLAMPWALMRLDIDMGARLRALRGMATVLLGADEADTLEDWLRRRGQTGLPDAVLWRPLCRAVMNVEPVDASANEFLATLREAFMGRASSAAFVLPSCTWGELLGDPAPQALAAAGVAVRTGARVVGLPMQAGCVTGIELGSGEQIAIGERDLVVSAMPWFALRRLLPEVVAMPLGTLASSPIVTAYLTVPAAAHAPADEGAVVALVDGEPFHFLLRRPGQDPRQFALLSGGDRSFDGKPIGEIEAIARRQLRQFYPDVDADAATVTIRKEQHATFVASPGSSKMRPRPGPLMSVAGNLWVCGDWTATGLPATLEGAARSAEQMLARLPAIWPPAQSV